MPWRAVLSDTDMKRDHAWFSCYRGQDLKVNVYDGRRTSDGKC